jgi:hypothetical protein
MSEIKQGISGPYYDHLPEEFRLATEDDYNNGAFINNRAFLIKRHDEEYYECHRVKFPVKPKILEFIRAGRVFVYV